MKRGARPVALCAALVASFFVGTSRAAEPWLGLFEDHGVAAPANAKRAREAVAAARRLGVECYELYSTDTSYAVAERVCRDGRDAAQRLGPDIVAAALDELERPGIGHDPFRALLGFAAGSGRVELVPVFVRALERIADRVGAPDAAIREPARWALYDLHEGLRALTYAEAYETGTSSGSMDLFFLQDDALAVRCAKAWRAWLDAHPKLDRRAWREEAIATAREQLASSDHAAAARGAVKLTQVPETRSEGIAALEGLRKRPGWPADTPPINVQWHLDQLRRPRAARR